MTDQPTLRDRIRRVLAEADGFSYDCLEPHDYQRHADAILALPEVLPTPVDRAAVLREAAVHLKAQTVGLHETDGIAAACDLLFRMAGGGTAQEDPAPPFPPIPSGCHWCGIAQRGHDRQWTQAAGGHLWTQPTSEQIKDRMQIRHLHRRADEAQQPEEAGR